MTEVVTLGECLIAFVATTPGPLAEANTFERYVVGAEANVAVGLARLGHSVAFIGRVGADGFGEAIRRRLRGEGVETGGLAIRTPRPGSCSASIAATCRPEGRGRVVLPRRAAYQTRRVGASSRIRPIGPLVW